MKQTCHNKLCQHFIKQNIVKISVSIVVFSTNVYISYSFLLVFTTFNFFEEVSFLSLVKRFLDFISTCIYVCKFRISLDSDNAKICLTISNFVSFLTCLCHKFVYNFIQIISILCVLCFVFRMCGSW